MSSRIVKSLFVLSSFLAFTPPVPAADLCSAVFESPQDLAQSPAFPQDPVTLSRVRKEIQNSKTASDFFMTELRKESNKIQAKFKNKVLELDFLCIGAGPQCAAASLMLGGLDLRSLVLEKTDLVAKTFAEKDFFINSVETDVISMHQFPNGIGDLADHTSQKYAMSSQLAAHIQLQQYASKVPVLLNTTMTNIRVLQKEGKPLLEITTDQGMVITAKNLILGTGLGEVGTKVKDAKYQEVFNANYKKHLSQPDVLQTVMSTDTFLTAIKNTSLSGQKVQMPKHLIMIGDGDGSRISVEALNSTHIKLPEGFHITWIGNNFKTTEEYLASRGGGDRYVHQIVPFYTRGQIKGMPGHVQAWDLLPDATMRLSTTDKTTGENFETVGDMIVDATGYENSVPHILSNVGAQAKPADITAPLPDLNLPTTVIGRQALSESGKTLPIFIVGAAAGNLATPEELANTMNKNPIAILNTVPRTSMLISQITGTTPAASVHGLRKERQSVRPAADMIKDAKKRRSQQISPPLTLNLEETTSLRRIS